MSTPQGSFGHPRRTMLPWDFLIIVLARDEAFMPLSQHMCDLYILQLYGKTEVKIITDLINNDMYKAHSDAIHMQ